ARAGDVARGAEDGVRAGAERVALAGRRAVQRDGDPPQRRTQSQDGGVEARPAHRARADEVVVLLVDPPLVVRIRLGTLRRPGVARLLLDLVARTLVREQACGDLTDDVAVVERAEDAGVGDLADLAAAQLPTR